jgi:nicotinamidase-related amidase
MQETRTIHLAIDLQDKFLQTLDPSRAQGFPKDVRRFADRLKKNNIPTLWVVFYEKREFKYFSNLVDGQGRTIKFGKKLIEETGLKCPLRRGEGIFAKSYNDAFLGVTLENILREQRFDTVILTGMSTCACITKTAEGAVPKGFGCYVIYDLLADYKEKENGGDPAWHKKELMDSVNFRIRQSPLFSAMTQRELLAKKLFNKAAAERPAAKAALNPASWFQMLTA